MNLKVMMSYMVNLISSISKNNGIGTNKKGKILL
jgi:hypothetical protein